MNSRVVLLFVLLTDSTFKLMHVCIKLCYDALTESVHNISCLLIIASCKSITYCAYHCVPSANMY